MHKVITYCDRCNKEFEKLDYKRKQLVGVVELNDEYPCLVPSQKDLCRSCYTELEDWWNLGSQAEDDEFPFE